MMESKNIMEPTNIAPTNPVIQNYPDTQAVKPTIHAFNNLTVISVGIFVLLAISVVAFFYYQNQHLKSILGDIPSPTPTPMESDNILTGWKVIVNPSDNYEFRVPANWKKLPTPSGSNHQIIFQSTDGLYRVTVDTLVNKNKATGKAYKDLDEFIGLPYTVKTLTVDNQDARQPLPRAGSESLDKVFFFSPDLKFIYSIELLVGDGTPTDHRVTIEALKTGSDIFDKILSTFKLTSPATLPPVPTTSDTVSTPYGKVCTQEAKLCPNGSSVGRTGPNCEFAPCPTPATQ